MTTVPLNEFAAVTLDASGNGTAKIGPNAHGVTWHPQVVSVKTSTKVKSPGCSIYAGFKVSDQFFVDGTYTGEQDSTDSIAGQELHLGQFAWAVWTGGDVGAQATVTVTGSKDI